MEAYHEDRVKRNTAVVVEKNHEEEEEEEEKVKSSTAPASASPASSPSHEFSFTISLHSSSDDKSRPPPASFAIDLSPADDIFFHGHLLPLHFLSHLPVSPRSSANSLDSFTLPIRDLLDEQRRVDGSCNATGDHHNPHQRQTSFETKIRSKLKSFSFFGLKNWQRKAQKETEDPKQRHDNKQKRKLGLSQVLKRLVRAPLFSRRDRRRENLDDLQRQPYSFSGDLLVKNRHDLRGLRGQYSAPASMRTSPTNSGHLVATTNTATASLSSSTSDSTMEELQAAIQAAIAHCKNSIALEPRQEEYEIKCIN